MGEGTLELETVGAFEPVSEHVRVNFDLSYNINMLSYVPPYTISLIFAGIPIASPSSTVLSLLTTVT